MKVGKGRMLLCFVSPKSTDSLYWEDNPTPLELHSMVAVHVGDICAVIFAISALLLVLGLMLAKAPTPKS